MQSYARFIEFNCHWLKGCNGSKLWGNGPRSLSKNFPLLDRVAAPPWEVKCGVKLDLLKKQKMPLKILDHI